MHSGNFENLVPEKLVTNSSIWGPELIFTAPHSTLTTTDNLI